MRNYTGIKPEQFWSLYYDTGGLYILKRLYSKTHEAETIVLQSHVMCLAKAWNRNTRNIKGMLHAHGSACMIGVVIGVFNLMDQP